MSDLDMEFGGKIITGFIFWISLLIILFVFNASLHRYDAYPFSNLQDMPAILILVNPKAWAI